MATHYETLGITSSADTPTIRRAYRRLARTHHPDVNPSAASHETMALINEAYQTLIDADRREQYDAMLRAGVPAMHATRFQKRAPITVRLESRLKGHRTPVYGLVFEPGSQTLVSCGFDNELIWWDVGAGAEIRRLRADVGSVTTLQSVPSGELFAAGAVENAVNVFRIGGERTQSWRSTSAEWGSCVALSADGALVATGTVLHALHVADTASGKKLYGKRDHVGSVTAVAWSADGKFLASGSSDTTVRVRDAASGETLITIKQVLTTVTAIAFSPDNRFLAAASVDLSVRVFSLEDGSLRKVFFGHTLPIECMAFHPNGWLFATGGRDGLVGLWNAAEGLGQVKLEASHRPILSLAFSPRGDRLATAGMDKLVRIWSLKLKAPSHPGQKVATNGQATA